MEKTIKLNKTDIKFKGVTTFCAIAGSVILPQIFHWIGAVSGLGTSVGASFLPMHIPVLIAGLLFGPLVGTIAGVLSPVISAMITGMPVGLMVPVMVVELGSYGLISGLLKKTNMPSVVKLLITMISGRLMRLACVAIIIYAFGNQTLTLISVWTAVVQGLPGIVLQLTIIPLVLYRFNGVKKAND